MKQLKNNGTAPFSFNQFLLTLLLFLPVITSASQKSLSSPTDRQLITVINHNDVKQLKTWLRSKKIDLRKPIAPYHMTPYMFAVWRKQQGCAKALLSYGAKNPFVGEKQATIQKQLQAIAIKSAGLEHIQIKKMQKRRKT